MKNALLWPYKFDEWEEDWALRLRWISEALSEEGYEIFKPKQFKVDIGNTKDWNNEKFDIIIYNHTDLAEIKALYPHLEAEEHTWFFKPTVPDKFTTTLDELGYGSYSTITYDKPPYEEADPEKVHRFYADTVSEWVRNNDSKWGEDHFKEKLIPHKDFYLVIGQCGGDSVVTRQDFGGYFEKLERIVQELLIVDPDREVVVKLHPYTNGPMHDPNRCSLIKPLTEKFESFSKRVKVYSDFSSIHSFLPSARCVLVGNSGAGFEAMMHDKPIISFCFPEYHWVTYDLRKTCDLGNAIQLNWFNKDAQRRFLYWYMEKYCFYDYNSAKRRVDDLLEEEIEYRVLFS